MPGKKQPQQRGDSVAVEDREQAVDDIKRYPRQHLNDGEGQGFTPLLPFYILKLRKAAKRVKTDAEKWEVEEGFKELGLKLKEAIEAGGGSISEEDTVTLLERLYELVEYTGRGYRTMEIETILDNSLKGTGRYF
jgi:hypothetical protein